MKDKYLQAMIDDRGHLNEIELGESLGLTETETTQLISKLLDEHKIEFVSKGACSYKPFKSKTK